MRFLFCMVLASGVGFAHAQTASVKDIPAEGDTTISISKGSKASVDKKFEIVDGNADISGDPEVLQNAARNSWKKSCNEWKQELKDLNKDNQVLALTCNSPKCEKNESSQTVCKSTGAYKVKVKLQ